MSEKENEIAIVKRAGGLNPSCTLAPSGILVWWTDPISHTTLAMYAHEINSVEDVWAHMVDSRAKFGQ